MGFRGEALPSIASVSRLTLTTRRAGRSRGDAGRGRGRRGSLGVARSARRSAPPSRSRDLLYNLPARLKFLKGEATEASHVTDLVAQGRDGVPARCTSGSSTTAAPRSTCRPTATASRARRRCSARGSPRAWSPVTGEEAGVRVDRLPRRARSSRRPPRAACSCSSGKRPVRDRGLLHAVAMGYGELVPRGRYPIAIVLRRRARPARSTSTCTRRSSRCGSPTPAAVAAAVRHVVQAGVARGAVARRVGGAGPVQMTRRERRAAGAAVRRPRGDAAGAALCERAAREERARARSRSTGRGRGRGRRGPGSTSCRRPASPRRRPSGRGAGSSIASTTPSSRRSGRSGARRRRGRGRGRAGGAGGADRDSSQPARVRRQARSARSATTSTTRRSAPSRRSSNRRRPPRATPRRRSAPSSDVRAARRMPRPSPRRCRPRVARRSATTPPSRPGRCASAACAASARRCREPEPEPAALAGYFSSLRYLGQLDLTYLVCEADGELVLVDQHAAHERVELARLRRPPHRARRRDAEAPLPDDDRGHPRAARGRRPRRRRASPRSASRPSRSASRRSPSRRSPPASTTATPPSLLRRLLDEWAADDAPTEAERVAPRARRDRLPLRRPRRRPPLHRRGRSPPALARRRRPHGAHAPHGRATLLRLPLSEIGRRFGR